MSEDFHHVSRQRVGRARSVGRMVFPGTPIWYSTVQEPLVGIAGPPSGFVRFSNEKGPSFANVIPSCRGCAVQWLPIAADPMDGDVRGATL